MTEIYLDIETIPSQQDWVKEYVAENTKPPGNIKKPESIEKWELEKKEAAIEDAMKSLSFDGAMNQIITIGAAVNDEKPVSFRADTPDQEREMLIAFFAWLQKTDKFGRVFIGHNITLFDLRVIRQRCIITQTKPPEGIPFDAKPWDKNPFDTMMQWDAKNMVKLDKLARAMGIKGKDGIDGSQVYDYWKAGKFAEIAEYCESDVEMVREVYKRMKIMGV